MTSGATTWAIVVGEYPPQLGGVSDYTWNIAHALHAAGDNVVVYAPGAGVVERDSPIPVHRLSDGFGLRGIARLHRQLKSLPAPRRILLQFVVQSFGMRAVNLPFAAWLRSLHGFPLWIMFHEYAIRDEALSSPLRRVQALGTRIVADGAARAADRSFVSTAAWEPMIARAAPTCPVDWLPIPSNIPMEVTTEAVKQIGDRYRQERVGCLVGHFGTYRMSESCEALERLVPALCAASPSLHVLFMGYGSEGFAAGLLARSPILEGRIFGTGALESEQLANHLAACDVLVQPYPDGVTARRSSVIAGLALGVPTITTLGAPTEPFWQSSGGVLLVPVRDGDQMLAACLNVLGDDRARAEMSERARSLYASRFDVTNTLRLLRSP